MLSLQATESGFRHDVGVIVREYVVDGGVVVVRCMGVFDQGEEWLEWLVVVCPFLVCFTELMARVFRSIVG